MPNAPLPVVLIPGLVCSPRFYAHQIPALWQFGPVTVADHTRDDSMAAIARRILEHAPPRFALAGHSMGGYIALEVMRQAADRVARLALLNTAATPETPEQTEKRRALMALAESGRYAEVPDLLAPAILHPSRHEDPALLRVIREMAEDNGPETFIRQQTAIIGRPDSRPSLAAIRCPTLIMVGDSDVPTPPERSREMTTAIAGSTLVVIPQSGHMTALEEPEQVTVAMVAWLTG